MTKIFWYGLYAMWWASTVAFSPMTLLQRTTSVGRSATEREDDPYDVATQLLGIVLKQQAQLRETSSPFDAILRQLTPSYGKTQKRTQRTIEYLMERLSALPNSYDPTESLLGPYYSTIYTFTPGPSEGAEQAPLWEKISLRKDNLKGQQYYLNKDFEKILVNYAQIWGQDVALRAKATFELAPEEKKQKKLNPFTGLFSKGRGEKLQPTERTCPDVFMVRVVAAELLLWGNKLAIPIRGEAKLVVLYADPRIRILVSPDDSDSVVGAWENSGLLALQVRGDLITGEYLDLR